MTKDGLTGGVSFSKRKKTKTRSRDRSTYTKKNREEKEDGSLSDKPVYQSKDVRKLRSFEHVVATTVQTTQDRPYFHISPPVKEYAIYRSLSVFEVLQSQTQPEYVGNKDRHCVLPVRYLRPQVTAKTSLKESFK